MITDSYDTETGPLISLRDVYGAQGDLADVCIITFSSVILRSALDAGDCRQIAAIRSCGGDIPIYALSGSEKRIAFYQSPIGATVASQCVLEANWLTGASRFILFGSAGSLDSERTAGRLVVPTAAYRDEGMSYHYAPPADYITIPGSAAVRAAFNDLRLPFVEGRTWTTDAILRETAGQAARRRAEGCVAVEMEIAGVQAVCDFHRLSFYPFLVTGDVLSEDSYSIGSLADANHCVDNFRVALELAARV